MKRCPSGSAPTFLRRRRGRPDRTVGPDGRRPDRPGGQRCVCVSGASSLSSASPPCRSSEPTLSLLQAPSVSSSPLCLSRLSLPQAHPGCACSPVLRDSSPRRSRALSLVPAACARAGQKPAFACGVPGALRGTWVSPTRFDEDERPVSRERLDMRGTYSHEASSWARGYYAE